MNSLVNSQEPPTPAVPGGTSGSPARTRKSTRRSKLVEETSQNEILPTGDEAEIREVREVREVVKRVAVVRAKKKGASVTGPQIEEVATEEEEGVEEEAAAPRRSTRRQETSARLGRELDEVMAAAETADKVAAGGRRSGAGATAAPGATVRAYEVEVTETEEGSKEEEEGEEVEEEEIEEEEEEAAAEGIAAEEPAGTQQVGGAAGRRSARRFAFRDVEETQAEEPFIPMEYIQATQEGTTEKESTEEEEEGEEEKQRELPTGALAGAADETEDEAMFLTPDEIPGSFPAEDEEEIEEEEMPAPSTKRGKRAAEPETPGKGIRGARTGGTLRSVLPGSSKGAATPRYEEEEEEEEEEILEEAGEEEEPEEEEELFGEAEEEEEEEEDAVPAPAPIPTRASASTKKLPAKKAPAPSSAKKGRKKIPAGAGGGGRRHRTETYRRYIFKVLKQVHPDYGISSKAMDVMHNFVVDQFDKIVEEAARLCKKDKKKTLTAVDIQTAVRLVLPGALGDHAIAEGKKAVLRISRARM